MKNKQNGLKSYLNITRSWEKHIPKFVKTNRHHPVNQISVIRLEFNKITKPTLKILVTEQLEHLSLLESKF